jgi:hypothetical protein
MGFMWVQADVPQYGIKFHGGAILNPIRLVNGFWHIPHPIYCMARASLKGAWKTKGTKQLLDLGF